MDRRRTDTLIAALAAGALAAATVQAVIADEPRHAASFAALTVLLAAVAYRTHQSADDYRRVAARADRLANLYRRRPPEADVWCCELELITVGREHSPYCRSGRDR